MYVGKVDKGQQSRQTQKGRDGRLGQQCQQGI